MDDIDIGKESNSYWLNLWLQPNPFPCRSDTSALGLCEGGDVLRNVINKIIAFNQFLLKE